MKKYKSFLISLVAIVIIIALAFLLACSFFMADRQIGKIAMGIIGVLFAAGVLSRLLSH